MSRSDEHVETLQQSIENTDQLSLNSPSVHLQYRSPDCGKGAHTYV
jgi:hypothetical protein